MVEALTVRCVASLEEAGGGLHLTRERAAQAILDALQPELDELARLRNAVQAVADLAYAGRGALGPACTCPQCEDDEQDNCGTPPTWTAWTLDPAVVLAAIDSTEEDR